MKVNENETILNPTDSKIPPWWIVLDYCFVQFIQLFNALSRKHKNNCSVHINKLNNCISNLKHSFTFLKDLFRGKQPLLLTTEFSISHLLERSPVRQHSICYDAGVWKNIKSTVIAFISLRTICVCSLSVFIYDIWTVISISLKLIFIVFTWRYFI